MTIRKASQRIGIALLLALTLAGCGSTGSFDPTDLMDFLDTKKKLPGNRQPVFPEGVPGVERGVPQEMIKGNNPQPQTEAAPTQAVAAAPPAEPAPPPEKPKKKPKPKKQRAAAPPPQAEPQSDAEPEPQAAPPVQRPQQQPQSAPFPAPLPSGTFRQ